MQEGNSNSMCENEQPRAMVRKHPALKRRYEFKDLIGEEVVLDPTTATTFKLGNQTQVTVKVSHKDHPTISSFIAANFLVPLTESAKKLLAIENYI